MESVSEEISLSPAEELAALVDGRITDDVFSSLPDISNSNNQEKGSTRSSETPRLISAIRRGSSSVSRFLKEVNASEVHITKTDSYERNAFHYSVNKPDALKMLKETFKSFPSTKEALRHEDKDGRTPIHQAAFIGKRKSIKMLHECDNSLIKLRSKISKRSVLHYAVQSASLVAVEYILSIDPNQLDIPDSMARTVVHYAARLKQRNVMDVLISKGADTTKEDANGQLPIHIAASTGFLTVVELLLQNEPSFINCIDNSGKTPLLVAAQNGFHNVVSYLLHKNADYTIKDYSNNNAFDWAIQQKRKDVIEVFFDKSYWKEVVLGSKNGAENCLVDLIEDLPETAVKLMDKCIILKEKDDSLNYQLTYDFFCLESKDNPDSKSLSFKALSCMANNVVSSCLSHPLCVKYINEKWRKRGFKYHVASVLLTLLFHICLMIYTFKVRGTVTTRREIQQASGKKLRDRLGSKPDENEIMALRIIMLVYVFGTMLKELTQIFFQRFGYFLQSRHYYQWALFFSVLFYVLPVNQAITARQLGSGSISVLISWLNLVQFLQMLPVFGVYILAVVKVFWTLMKILVVIFLFLLSFSSTFYIILAEHESFNNFGISVVSSFNAMINGIDYETLFVEEGSYPNLYNVKLAVLVFFIIIMSIVVNNTLIGLAVGDTEQVMKFARFEKLRHKALFIIHLEKSLNPLPGFHLHEHQYVTEYPKRKRSNYKRIIDFIYFGQKIKFEGWDKDEEKSQDELGINVESQLEKILAPKLDEIRSTLHEELKEIFKRMEKYQADVEERKQFDQKILEKLSV